MSAPAPSPAERLFDELVDGFRDDPDVDPPAAGGAFGAAGLKVGGKLFAVPYAGGLLLKLPRDRVEELVGSGRGERHASGGGRVMKEWVVVPAAHGAIWRGLAEEARGFVAPRRG